MKTERETDQILSIIQLRMEQAQNELKKLEERADREVSGSGIGKTSRMETLARRRQRQEAMQKLKDKIADLKLVRSRLGTAEFGICDQCRTPLPVETIMLIPETRVCVECASGSTGS